MRPKKLFCLLTALVLALSLCACAKPQEPAQQWACQVAVAEASIEDKYVITYYGERLISTTGALTFQNDNDFDIVVHLLAAGERERTSTVPPGGVCAFLELTKGAEYQVGFHADMPENTPILVTAYDGETNNP